MTFARSQRPKPSASRAHPPGWLLCWCFIFLSAQPSPAPSFPLTWRWSNPAPHGNNIVDMVYSPEHQLAVQVCERGRIYSSDTLTFWIPRESGTTGDLRAVAFFENQILIAGANGLVLQGDLSLNFNSATLLDGPTTDWLEALAVSTNIAVTVGDYGAIYTTTTGSEWKRQNSTVNDWLMGVAYGTNGFVAVGENGRVLTSPNGTNWTRRTSGTATELHRVSFYHGRYVAVGSNGLCYASHNGISWAAETTGATHPLWHSAGNDNAAIVVGDHELRLKGVGATTWVNQLALTNGPADWSYYANIALDDYFMVGGRTGMLVEGFSTNSSPYFWLPVSQSVRHLLFDVTYPGPVYVAVGDQATLLSSGNGIDWTLELPPSSTTSSTFLGVGGDTNMLIAVGDAGTLIISPNTYTNITVTNIVEGEIQITNKLVSTLGVVWHSIEPRPTAEDLQGVTAGNGLYLVTGGNGTILHSADGTNWVSQSAPTNSFLSSIASWPGGFVACGDQGTLMTSPDGVAWTLVPTGITNWIYRVRYAGDRLIAAGQKGIILTSLDAGNWTPQTSGTSALLTDALFIDDHWFVVGLAGTVLASSNAVDWVNLGTITKKDLWTANTDGKQLIIAGTEGIILRSQVVPDTNAVSILAYSRVLVGNSYQNIYLLGGEPDQRFSLDRRADFATNQWITGPVLEFFDSSGTLYYVETIPASQGPPTEYYRAALLLSP